MAGSSRISLSRWWRLPLWVAALGTGAKSFRDNPLLGSRRLNRLGLHAGRVRLAHALAGSRRARIASTVPPEWRAQFDRDGFVALPDFLPAAEFAALREEVFGCDAPTRAQQQGDTITRRVAAGPELLAKAPGLSALIDGRGFRALLAYVASTRSPPLFYLQAIDGGVVEGPPDPQIALHSDCFQPSMKAWLFLTDVGEEERPLTYVAGSHRLTPERLAWERARSLAVLDEGDVLSQRGSLRVTAAELEALGLPEPTRFAVRANTLVVADTFGFHARSDASGESRRVEIWAYARRTPFLPWTGLDPVAALGLEHRRAGWLLRAIDWLDRRGWAKQHWREAGPWRDHVQARAQSPHPSAASRLPPSPARGRGEVVVSRR